MAWATSLIAPPDGDLSQFITSCEQTRARAPQKLLPAHGEAIENPRKRIDWLINHRMERTAQIITALCASPQTPQELTKQIYCDIKPNLWHAAEQNILAHLIDLMTKNLVLPEDALSIHSKFQLT
jgi:glyoxylase-like metal-dependent hydrolase (beta-lactamase superfamily II)